MRNLACYDRILKDKRYFSYQRSVLDCFLSSSGTRSSPLVLLDIGHDDPDDLPIVQEYVLFPYIAVCCHISYSIRHISCSSNAFFFLVGTNFVEHPNFIVGCVNICPDLHILDYRRRSWNYS
jgi:hypothetical protein